MKHLAPILAVAGVALVVMGVGLVWVPAALILTGVAMLTGALLFDPEATRRRR